LVVIFFASFLAAPFPVGAGGHSGFTGKSVASGFISLSIFSLISGRDYMERTCRILGFDLYFLAKNPTFDFSKFRCGKVTGGIEKHINL
jgi:hypothetical protein